MKRWFCALLALGLAILPACHTTNKDVTVYMPDGAPALAFTQMMHEDTKEDGVTYRVVAPAVIRTKVTYEAEEKNADLCVLPLTAATKLLGDGTRYQMLGAVTHGNLYLISKQNQTYNKDNLCLLIGKSVGVLQLNEVPGLIFKTVLRACGVPYVEGDVTDENAVRLLPITGAQDVGALSGVDVYLLAEPAVSAQSKKGFVCVGDMQRMYGENGYPQAVLVAKKSLIDEKQAWLSAFLQKLAGVDKWLESASMQEIVNAVHTHLEDETYASVLQANKLSNEVLARCGVRLQTDCSVAANAFLRAASVVNDKMAVLPSEQFYCKINFEV